MSSIEPAVNAAPATWLLASGVDWWDLVRYGPPGFQVYARIRLGHQYGDGKTDTLHEALMTLMANTSTPQRGYAAIWEGWGAGPPDPVAPRVGIPNREMLLFTGPISAMRYAPSLAWRGSVVWDVEPHLLWPADHAWCLACEVDEEIEFTVGCSQEAYAALVRVLPGGVRRVRYGENVPLYSDESTE